MRTIVFLLLAAVAAISTGCSSTIPIPRIKSTGHIDPAEQGKVLEESSNAVMASLKEPIEKKQELLVSLETSRDLVLEQLNADAKAAPEDKLSEEELQAWWKRYEYFNQEIAKAEDEIQGLSQQMRFAAERMAMGDAQVYHQLGFAQMVMAEAEYQSGQTQASKFGGALTNLGSNDPRTAARRAEVAKMEAEASLATAKANEAHAKNRVWYLPWTW